MKSKIIITLVALWIACGPVWGDSVFTATVIGIMDEGQAAIMSVEPVDPVQGAVTPHAPTPTSMYAGISQAASMEVGTR